MLDDEAKRVLIDSMLLEEKLMEAIMGVIMFENPEAVRAAFRAVTAKVEHICDHPLDFNSVEMEDVPIFTGGPNV